MAFFAELEDDEELLYEGVFSVEKGGNPFALAISDRAAYLPRLNRLTLGDPWDYQRVPLAEIRAVELERLRPYWTLLLALLCLVSGAVTSYLMLQPQYARDGGRPNGWPFALLVGGLVIPFVARGRRRLVVTHATGRVTWKAPMVIDRATRERIREIQAGIVEAFELAGVPVRVPPGEERGLPVLR